MEKSLLNLVPIPATAADDAGRLNGDEVIEHDAVGGGDDGRGGPGRVVHGIREVTVHGREERDEVEFVDGAVIRRVGPRGGGDVSGLRGRAVE